MLCYESFQGQRLPHLSNYQIQTQPKRVTLKIPDTSDEFDVSVVGIMDDDGKSTINPSSDELLASNQTIILIGEVEKMDLFKEQLP